MAAHTVHARRYVRVNLASCSTAVMAAGAIGGVVEQTVVRLGTRPCTSGFVATLAHCLAIVDGGIRPYRDTETGAHVAGCALRRHRHVRMKHARIPTGVASLMTTVAVGDSNAC